MRKNYLILALLFACSSCSKILEYYNHSNDKDPSKCKIVSIKNYDPQNGALNQSLDFEYFEDGRLKGVFEQYPATDPDGIYSEYWPYEYDEKGRLTRTGALSTPHPTANLYVYEGNATLPARDTIIRMDGPLVEYLKYDSQGRIIQVNWRHWVYSEEGEIVPGDSSTYRYYYDLRGNRQEHPSNPGYDGLVVYDDKPSLYSLSPALRLQYKNWSRNSTLVAESYNEHGLPLKLAEDQPHLQPLIDMYGGASIEYECD